MNALIRPAVLTLALAFGTPGLALAQGTQTALAPHGIDLQSLREIDDRSKLSFQGVSVDDLDDMKVFDASGRKIGEVEKVLGDGSNTITALVIEIEGIQGIDDKELVVPAERIQVDGQNKRLLTTMSESDLRSLPVWDR